MTGSGHDPEAEAASASGPEPTPYEVWVSDDPQATWDDPDLCGPADRPRPPEPEAEAGQ